MGEPLTPELKPRRVTTGRPSFLRGHWLWLGLVVAAAAALTVTLLVVLGGSDRQQPLTNRSGPVPVSASGLRTLADAVPSPIYWAGPMDGITYELTKTPTDRVFIRYLPDGVDVGSEEPHLTIATYPLTEAYSATERASRQQGAVPVAVQGDAIAFYNRSRPQSVYFTERGSNYQVEVYAPSAERARTLVSSGRIRAVVDKSASEATAASAQRLRTVAASLDHPVYWLGEKGGFTYELTQTSGDRFYVRYLPRGVQVGANTAYLTVGTYRYPNAVEAVRRLADQVGTVPMKLARGGLAVVDSNYPMSVHVAYPGSNYQVEVFDPSPDMARKIVAAGEVQPIR